MAGVGAGVWLGLLGDGVTLPGKVSAEIGGGGPVGGDVPSPKNDGAS